jgi:hypothetical protein
MHEDLRSLKATELKLLQERTKLQRRIEESSASGTFHLETIHELDRRRDQVEEELQSVRAHMRRLEREGPEAE